MLHHTQNVTLQGFINVRDCRLAVESHDWTWWTRMDLHFYRVFPVCWQLTTLYNTCHIHLITHTSFMCCHAWCQLHIGTNSGFSILLKDTSVGNWTSNLPNTRYPAQFLERQPPLALALLCSAPSGICCTKKWWIKMFKRIHSKKNTLLNHSATNSRHILSQEVILESIYSPTDFNHADLK